MPKQIPAKEAKVFIAKLDFKSDLLVQLTDIAIANNINLGKIEAIGAVSKATVGYYNQDSFKYQYETLNKHLEIISLIGNISLKDNKPVIHAHITLADENEKAYGGHLAPGTVVFACEVVITVFDSEEKLERGLDKNTKLPLWKD
ncbi:MAG: DNA-binding protein [Victivallales bacterium]|nr:DNA-binding protein [Victivallales bacterium]MCF7889349.1 DNA-binding protein [Victivallales bacterium]